MAYRGRGNWGGRGRASAAFSNYQPRDDDDDKPSTPLVDKNPHYRTNDIFNGVFKKRVRLLDGAPNSTDGKVINLKFRDPIKQMVAERMREGEGEFVYRLACGHPRVLKKRVSIGFEVDCFVCGNHQSYLALQHEWSHIMFHSFHPAWTMFVEQTTNEYSKLAPGIDKEQLKNFLHLVVNAYDDTRCNSLLGKVYRGAAADIWVRWRRLSDSMGLERKNQDFIAFALSVAIGSETDPTGQYEPLRPIIEWSMDRVKERGPANMLAIVKVALDRCIGAILKNIPPPAPKLPSPPMMPPPPGGAQQPQPQPGGAGMGQQGGQDDDQEPDQDQGDSDCGDPSQDQDKGPDKGPDNQEDGEPDQSPAPPTDMPSAKDLAANGEDLTSAVKQLTDGAQQFDDSAAHPQMSLDDALKDPSSNMAIVLTRYAMGMDEADLQQFDQSLQDGQDADVARSLQQLQNAITDKSPDSQLTDGSKAKVLFIDVAASHIDETSYTTLAPEERRYVDSLRSAFYKVMGQQKAARGNEGQELDVQAAIQYLIETGLDDTDQPQGTGSNQAIFKNITTQQGFAYMILGDMSGSMCGRFPYVAQAFAMLKKALDFPFVTGDMWGFRGTQAVQGRSAPDGEVWLYRYARDCKGYTGMSPVKAGRHFTMFPVECGGITPMNSALTVAARHTLVRVPAGMAKRLFILTDGSPLQTKVTGQVLPEFLLRKYVRDAVNTARQHGVQVYALIIGDEISDEKAKKMFGNERFWKRVASHDPGAVGKALFDLVRDNFTKYLKIHGGG